MEIWDLHCHLSGVPGATPIERMSNLLKYADRMGIRKLCVSMGMDWSYDPTPEKLRQDNDAVLAVIKHWPDRIFGLTYVNPKNSQASLDEIDRCIHRGPMVGIKLWVAIKCSDPCLDPILQKAAELQVPVYQHTWFKITGNLPGESTPEDLALLAKRHPTVSIICGHSGGDWELGIRTVRPYQNVSVDLSGGDPAFGVTEMAVQELGAERVLFGSDAGGRSFASQLAKVMGAQIPDSVKERILCGNLKNILRPVLSKKGINL